MPIFPVFISCMAVILTCLIETSNGKPIAGVPRYYILGGHDAKQRSWPWQVGILVDTENFICGGTLVSPNVVITAAHCVEHVHIPGRLTVVLGDYNRLVDEGGEQIVGVWKFAIHPEYGNSFLGGFDLALLYLDTEVNVTADVSPLTSLATPTQVFEGAGYSCYITGWGLVLDGNKKLSRTTQGCKRKRESAPSSVGVVGELAVKLQEAPINVINNSECNTKRYWNGLVKVTNICAFYNDTGACEGDSGGPLVCKDTGGSFTLVGTTSWGSVECRTLPTVFISVAKFRGWIDQAINTNNINHEAEFDLKIDLDIVLDKVLNNSKLDIASDFDLKIDPEEIFDKDEK